MGSRAFAGLWAAAFLLFGCGDSGGDADKNPGLIGTAQMGGTGGSSMAAAGSAGSMRPMQGGNAMAGSGGSGMRPPSPGGAGAGAMAGAGGMAGGNSAGKDGSAGISGGAGGSGVGGAGAGGSAGGAGSTGPEPTGPAPTKESASREGPLNVERILWTDFRDGPYFSGGTIWYPSDGTPPYPFVAVVPGFASFESSISSWGPFLASHGIVTITIDTNTTGDIPAIRAGALLDALESVKGENTRSGSPLMGKLDESRQGLMGWSMGGGGTLIAAEDTPTLKAAISMCGWNPGGRYPMMKVPSLMFASLGDPLAGGQSQGFYSGIPDSTPKMLI
jgi:hypothetical protein